MSQGHSKVLPLPAMLASKATPWKWMSFEQKAFDQAKKIVSQETLLAYPYFNIPFEIHTDASDTQLRAVISQQRMPFVFYSCKLNSTQKNHTTMDQKLLVIVETLKEPKNLLSTDNTLFLLAKALTANDIKDLKKEEQLLGAEKSDDIMIVEYYIDKGESVIPLHIYLLSFNLLQKKQQKDKMFLEALKSLRQNMTSRFFRG
eukprot:224965-Ditylum_brightwellii.AAC.1